MPKKSSDAAGKKGTKKDETAPKESKKSKKAARQAAEAERARDVERMLAPASDAGASMRSTSRARSASAAARAAFFDFFDSFGAVSSFLVPFLPAASLLFLGILLWLALTSAAVFAFDSAKPVRDRCDGVKREGVQLWPLLGG